MEGLAVGSNHVNRAFYLAVAVALFLVEGRVLTFSPGSMRNDDMVAHASAGLDFDTKQWEIKDSKGRFENHLGRNSLYLTSGYAFMKDVVFEEGVIQLDIAS
jgi:hypothetical protein